jgi:cytoskeletal protein CcmA (bactofilin family)
MFNKQQKEEPVLESPRASKGPSILGPTLTFRGGELSSDEDLVIEGTVEGRIAHQNHRLTIGRTGKVKADVHASTIVIEGTVEGNIRGDEEVHIGRTGNVVGNVVAPRISIERGASFEGSVKTLVEPVKTEPVKAQPTANEPALDSLAGATTEVRPRRQTSGVLDH